MIPRDLTESPEYTDSIKHINKDVRRMDEILNGVTFTIAKNPKVGIQLLSDHKPIFLIKTNSFKADDCSFAIFYSFDQKEVLLIDIKKIKISI